MNLLISRQKTSWTEARARTILTPCLQALLRLEGIPESTEISLLLCDDSRIHALNGAHRGIDKPTDVLSFPQDDPFLLGDVVISLETAQRQAKSAGWPLESEVILLAIHGTLHLIGYDDETTEGALEMRGRTVAILNEAGVALPPSEQHPYLIVDS